MANSQGVALNLSVTDLATVSSTFISCRPRPKSAMFNITISPSGKVLASTQVSKATYSLPPSVNLTLPSQTAITNLGEQLDMVWHNDTFASDWSNYLFKTLVNSTSFLDASLPPPTFDAAAAGMSETYSRVFAIQMSLQSAQLARAPPDSSPIPCEILTLERRVFMSRNYVPHRDRNPFIGSSCGCVLLLASPICLSTTSAHQHCKPRLHTLLVAMSLTT